MTTALQSKGAPAETLVEGEFAFTGQDFERIRALLYAESRIHLPDAKLALVYSRLAKRLRALGLTSFVDYCALVERDESREERRAMVAALTTNVTRFFREPHHFDHLRKLLPVWIAEARDGGRLRIWSAGCSSGQEPYSIAMTLLSVFPEAASHDIRILGTDIDPVVIATAREGLYAEDLLEGISPEMRRKWLRQDGGRWRVADEIRRLITFNELNLMEPWPIKGRFQAIFCRNVCIYFDQQTQDGLWSRYGDAMTADGRLYIGHSERIQQDRFETDGLTVYKLAGRGR
jgi:chemotaxis protein methyltransferase CheR